MSSMASLGGDDDIGPDYPRRRRELASRLAELPGPPTGFLITRQPNVRYFTGFVGSNAVALVDREGRAVLGTDARYASVAARVQESDETVEVVLERATLAACAEAGARRGHVLLAVEGSFTVGEAAVISAASMRTVTDNGVLAQIRSSKDPGERATIARACAITSQALEAVLGEIVPPDSELIGILDVPFHC